jgi:hypothetical protein
VSTTRSDGRVPCGGRGPGRLVPRTDIQLGRPLRRRRLGVKNLKTVRFTLSSPFGLRFDEKLWAGSTSIQTCCRHARYGRRLTVRHGRAAGLGRLIFSSSLSCCAFRSRFQCSATGTADAGSVSEPAAQEKQGIAIPGNATLWSAQDADCTRDDEAECD